MSCRRATSTTVVSPPSSPRRSDPSPPTSNFPGAPFDPHAVVNLFDAAGPAPSWRARIRLSYRGRVLCGDVYSRQCRVDVVSRPAPFHPQRRRSRAAPAALFEADTAHGRASSLTCGLASTFSRSSSNLISEAALQFPAVRPGPRAVTARSLPLEAENIGDQVVGFRAPEDQIGHVRMARLQKHPERQGGRRWHVRDRGEVRAAPFLLRSRTRVRGTRNTRRRPGDVPPPRHRRCPAPELRPRAGGGTAAGRGQERRSSQGESGLVRDIFRLSAQCLLHAGPPDRPTQFSIVPAANGR